MHLEDCFGATSRGVIGHKSRQLDLIRRVETSWQEGQSKPAKEFTIVEDDFSKRWAKYLDAYSTEEGIFLRSIAFDKESTKVGAGP